MTHSAMTQTPEPERFLAIRKLMTEVKEARFKTRDGRRAMVERSWGREKGRVTIAGSFKGSILSDGAYSPANYLGDEAAIVIRELRRFNERPRALMIRYGREEGQCSACGRRLTNPVSVRLGIGPVCGGRVSSRY